MSADEDAYNELCCYTLTHGDPAFIHQHVVDAFAVQTADEDEADQADVRSGRPLPQDRAQVFRDAKCSGRTWRSPGRKHAWPPFPFLTIAAQ